jgi:hypothetical protein
MSANTLTNRSIGQTILDTFFNDIHSALDGDFVGRGASGIPTSGQNLGTVALPWGSVYCSSVVINGSTLDTSKIVSIANRIVSGKTRTTSNQPAFLTPNGSAASVIISGSATNLVLSINSATVTVNTDVTKTSLSTAPNTQNTAVVNDTTAGAQSATRTWGEYGAPNKITIGTVGTNITALVGKWATFKIVHSGVTEYFLAFVESSTLLSHCIRGFFYDNNLNPINATVFTNGDTITLMNTGFVYMTNDAATVDVGYTFPTYASVAPSSPVTGDYWYDTVNQVWKRYDGASFNIINRTLIGLVVMDATNCVAARALDFYAGASSETSIDLEVTSTATIIRAKRLFQSAVVNGKTVGFGYYLPAWVGASNYASSSTDYYATFSASTTYYLYLTDVGATSISDIAPLYRSDLQGFYHKHNPWRCFAVATTDGSSNWSYVGMFKKSVDLKLPNVVKLTTTGTTTAYLFTCTSANASIGATYTNNSQTFTVLGTIAASTQLICSAAGAPTASGTLTKATGTGDATITFSAEIPLATYVPSPDTLYLKVRMVGAGGVGVSGSNGGGGVGGSGGGAGGYLEFILAPTGNYYYSIGASSGGNTYFSNGAQINTAGGAGSGTGGGGSVTNNLTAQYIAALIGAGGQGANAANSSGGGGGGASPFGGAGGGAQGNGGSGAAAVANSGSGGGGGASNTSGSGAGSGAAGGSGVILIEECFQ